MKTNLELLEEVQRKKLQTVLDSETNDEETEKAFEEGMKATDRVIEMKKVESNETIKHKERRTNLIVQIAQIVIPFTIGATVRYIYDKRLATYYMDYEKTDTLTSSPGRTSWSSRFKF